MQKRDDFFLRHRLEVDQEITAANQIHSGERRIGKDVLLSEHAHITDRFADAISAIFFDKETPETIGRYIFSNVLGVEAGSGSLNTPVVDIGGKDLHGDMISPLVCQLGKRHGYGVRLFARRTTQDPDPHRLLVRSTFNDLREDVFLEQSECFRVPEKARHVYENVLI